MTEHDADDRWSAAQVKQFVGAILDEQRYGTEAAEREREKVAQALYARMDMRIEQIREIIAAARRESDLRHDASQTAIAKADTSNEKRFKEANEWRQQSADRERAHAEAMTAHLNRFVLREVADAQFAELRKQVSDLAQRNQDLSERITQLL